MTCAAPLRGWFVLLPVGLCFAALLHAKEPVQTATPKTVQTRALPLEQVPDAVSRIEEELPKRIDELLALVGKEAEAKRISEPAAHSLRIALRTQRAAPAGDLGNLLASARVPEDNRTLKDAFAELEALAMDVKNRRISLATAAIDVFRGRVAELFRTARSVDEVDALVALIGPAQDAIVSRSFDSGEWDDASEVFSLGRDLLDKLRSVLVAQSGDDSHALGAQVVALIHSNRSTLDKLNLNGAVEGRIDGIVKPLLAGSEKARLELHKAIIERKSVSELLDALHQFESRWELSRSMGIALMPEVRNASENGVEVYRRIISVVESLERRDASAAQALRELRQMLRQLPGGAARPIEEALMSREREIAEGVAKKISERSATLRQRLKGAKDPAELDEVAVAIGAWGREGLESQENQSNYMQVAQVLSGLAAAWDAGDPQLLKRYSSGADEVRHPYTAVLRALRARIERDVMSRALAAPELNQAPLVNQPTDAAVDQLASHLSAKGEWRRLLRLVELRNSLQTGRELQRPDELGIAIRAFLAGQNFEAAELWGDAVRSYKAVLTSSSEVAPLKAAADRLKALAIKYPEAVAQSAK